jgi:type I restriction-modification system DNA methylase subunit
MSLVKSKQRVADYGEVFTPAWMVQAMLDLMKDETKRIDSRFLKPACGSGNLIVQILKRKLAALEVKSASLILAAALRPAGTDVHLRH